MDPPYMAAEAEDGGNPQPQHPGLVVQQPGTALPFPTRQQSLPLPVSPTVATHVPWDPHLQCFAPVGSNPGGAPYEVYNRPPSAIDPRLLLQPVVQSPQAAVYHQDSSFHPQYAAAPPQGLFGPRPEFDGLQDGADGPREACVDPQGTRIQPQPQSTPARPQQNFVEINQAQVQPDPVFSQNPPFPPKRPGPFSPNFDIDSFAPVPVAFLVHFPYPGTVGLNGLPLAWYGPQLPEPGGGPSCTLGMHYSMLRNNPPRDPSMAGCQRPAGPVPPAAAGPSRSFGVVDHATAAGPAVTADQGFSMPPIFTIINPSFATTSQPAAPIPPIATAAPPASSVAGAEHLMPDPQAQPQLDPDPRPRQVPDTSFPLFGSLPDKIREAIWRLAVVPRTITVGVTATLVTGTPHSFSAATRTTWRASTPTQGVLLACRESHRAAAALYTRMPFPSPTLWEYGDGGGLEPVDVPIAPELDTVDFSADWSVNNGGVPIGAAARGASRQGHDAHNTPRLLLPLIGLTIIHQRRHMRAPGWNGWTRRLRHISFGAALIGDLAQGKSVAPALDVSDVWDGLIRYMENSPSFRTCTISIPVSRTANGGGGGGGDASASNALTRARDVYDNIRRIRIARRPLHYSGATKDLEPGSDLDSDSDSDLDGEARPPCDCHNAERLAGPLERNKRPRRLSSERDDAMRLDGSAECLLLDDGRLQLQCPVHVPRSSTCPRHGSRSNSSPLVPGYRHRLAILEVLDDEQTAAFCPARGAHEHNADFEWRRRTSAAQLGTRMRHHYCIASCHKPHRFITFCTREEEPPAAAAAEPATSRKSRAAAARAALATKVKRKGKAKASASEAATEKRHVVFGDSFRGDMHLLLHTWVANYRDVGSKELEVGVHGVCREDYGF